MNIRFSGMGGGMFGLNDKDGNQDGQNGSAASSVQNPPGSFPYPPPVNNTPAATPIQPAPPGQAPSNNASPSEVPVDDLLQIKREALSNLTPLVSHLGESTEDKFKTTMMLIQASDNPQLLPQAYELANKIEDEKQRAQALLDVVNEINYFTNQNGQN